MTLLSSGHMDERSWKDFCTTDRQGQPPSSFRHLHLQDTGWLPRPKGLIETHPHKPLPVPDHITILPANKPFLLHRCNGPGLCATRKASIMSWNSSGPLSRKTGTFFSRYKPTSGTLLPYVQTTYSCLSRMVAKHNSKSTGLPARKISVSLIL